MSQLMDIALAPARFVMALPKLVDGISRLPDIADSLERIANFEGALENLASLGALANAVEQLERVAGDLTQAVQPLQGVAQRLSRFGRGLGTPAS